MADVRRVIEIDVKTSAQAVATMRQLAADTEAMEKRFASLSAGAQGFINTLVGGLSVGALVHSIRSTSEAFDEMGKRSERLGIATEELSALTYQAKLANVSAEELDVAMVKLSKNMADLGGAATDGSKALAQLGIAGDDPVAALDKIAEQFSKMEDGAKKTALAVELFGKSGAKLIPMLNEGAAGIKRAREEADAYGITVRGDMVRAAQDFNDAMTRMNAALEGFRNSVITPMISGLAELTKYFYGAGTAALSFSDKVALTFPGDVNAKMEAWGKRLNELIAQRAEIEKRSPTAEIFLGPKEESIRAIDRQMAAIYKLVAERQRLLNVGHEIDRQQEAARTARKGGAIDIDTGAAARAEALAKELERLQAQIEGMTSEGKINKLNEQLGDVVDLELLGKISATVAAEAREKLTREILKQGDAYEQLTAELEDDADAMQKQQDRVEALYDALLVGDITLAQFNEKMDKMRDKQKDARDSFLELGEAIQRSVEGWSGKAAQAVVDFASGTQTNIRKMVDGILNEFARMALQITIFDPIFRSFGLLLRGLIPGGAAAGGGGADYGYNALGAAYGPGGRLAFARGGVVNKPTLFPFAGGTGLMGEAGPEAIMPLKRSASGALGVESQGGGVTVNVVNNSNADVSVEHGRDASDQRTITVMVEQSVQDAFSRGRFDSLMSSTYGLNRRGR